MSESMSVVCGSCDAVNVFPVEKLEGQVDCHSCGKDLFPVEPIQVNHEQLNNHLDNTGMPVIVDFGASWCGPCKSFAVTYDKFSESAKGKIRVLKVDTDASPKSAVEFNIRSLPTIGIYGGGNEIARRMGAMGLPDLEKWIVAELAY